jgi:hypothetical protein
MNSRKLSALLLLIMITLALFALGNGPSSKPVVAAIPQTSAHSRTNDIPDYVAYGFLFRLVSKLSDKTRELRSQGRIGKKEYLPLQKEASLTQGQARMLEAIASACQQEVARQDEKAKSIVHGFRAQLPENKQLQGKALPPPPAELKALSNERNEIVLRARERLRLGFGEESFTRFDNYVKFRFRTTSVVQ